jgi:hypothetical protein
MKPSELTTAVRYGLLSWLLSFLASTPLLAQENPVTITAPGLQAPVEIRGDRWGIPHIYAKNQHDLFFAQGYNSKSGGDASPVRWRSFKDPKRWIATLALVSCVHVLTSSRK